LGDNSKIVHVRLDEAGGEGITENLRTLQLSISLHCCFARYLLRNL
jgi:hypothetical protein